MELSKDLGHRPIVFIRFNPDSYTNQKNEKITSCWGSNKRGICTLKSNKINEWNERVSTLKDQIIYWISNKTEKMIEVIELFYDTHTTTQYT